jgi:death on curing protein
MVSVLERKVTEVVTSYLDLDDFVETAAELLALPEETVVKMARLDLAESTLHAPQAGWGEVEFYPDFAMQRQCCWSGCQARLPDGNK